MCSIGIPNETNKVPNNTKPNRSRCWLFLTLIASVFHRPPLQPLPLQLADRARTDSFWWEPIVNNYQDIFVSLYPPRTIYKIVSVSCLASVPWIKYPTNNSTSIPLQYHFNPTSIPPGILTWKQVGQLRGIVLICLNTQVSYVFGKPLTWGWEWWCRSLKC